MKELTQSSLKGVSSRALFAYKNGCFTSHFLLLGIDFYKPRKRQTCLSKSPSPKTHFNRTGSVFALPIFGCLRTGKGRAMKVHCSLDISTTFLEGPQCFGKWGFLCPKIKNQKKKSENQNADLFDFLLPVSSRHRTQKINISGPGFYASGKHDFSTPGTNSENLIFRFSDSTFRSSEVSEFSKLQMGAKHQSIGDPQHISL